MEPRKKFVLKTLCYLVMVLLLAGCVQATPWKDNEPDDDPIIDVTFFIERLSEPASFSLEGAIWVATDGVNALGRGTENQPFRTIPFALSQCSGGETILVRSGVYTEPVRVRHPNITLRSAPGHWAVIQVPTDDPQIPIALRMDVDSSGSKIQSLEIIGGYYYGIKFETRWDWGGEDRSGASHIIVEDCKIHDTGRDCIKITPGCDYITIRRCEIYRSGVGIANLGPGRNPNAEGIDNVNGDYMIVQESHIYDISTTGIYFKGGAQNCIVERNLIENCGHSGVLVGFDTSPEFFDLTVNPDYYESIHGVVRNNVILHTRYAGIGLYAAKDAHVYNNTLIQTAKDGMSPIFFGIAFQDWAQEAGRPSSIRPRIINNIVVQEGIDGPMVTIRYSNELGGLSALEGLPMMDHNCYHTTSDAWFQDRRPTSYLERGSFATWQAHIQGEAHSMIADPLMIDLYTLQTDSPCIDAAKYLEYVSYDVDNQKRTRPFDIGAKEGQGKHGYAH